MKIQMLIQMRIQMKIRIKNSNGNRGSGAINR